MRRPKLAIVLLLAGLAGCGGGSHTTATRPQASPPAAPLLVVREREFRITPSPKRIALGPRTVRVVNAGTVPHALELEGPGTESEVAPLAPGKSDDLQLTLRSSGRYELYCPLDHHRKKGMFATLIVGGGA